MSIRIRVVISLIALAVLAVLPWLWRASPLLGCIIVGLAAAWMIWLMVVYLQWARGLGGKQNRLTNSESK